MPDRKKITLKDLDTKTTVWIILMHLGCLLAPFTFTWDAFFVFVFLFWVTGGLGICLCFHRLLTHRSFKVPKYFEYFLTILGCMSAQRSPIYWVARHRVHHAKSDTDEDPHSPRKGFWWAHMGWVFLDKRVEDENAYYEKYCPDLAHDAGHRWIQKTHEFWPLLLAALLVVTGGLPYLVWGLFVRTAAVYHATWLVNSAGHVWGYQNYNTGEDSQNNWWVTLLTFGEGWHNNHHAYQTWANHGHTWWEWDVTHWTIKLFELLGIATEVRGHYQMPHKKEKELAVK